MSTTPRQQMDNLIHRTATPVLCTSLAAIAAIAEPKSHEILLHAALIDEIEKRCPAAAQAAMATLDDMDTNPDSGSDYVPVLIATTLMSLAP
jgi:hypothetical protein